MTNEINDSKVKWNERHRDRELATPACEVLLNHISLLPSQGTALDLACGLGRNAILLAKQGLQCDAVDISDVALARLSDYAKQCKLAINIRCEDIECDGIGNKQYDVIVVSYFLYRPLFAEIKRALKPGGLLFYQTFVNKVAETENPNSGTRTSKSRFYLEENELSSHFDTLEIRYYEETNSHPNTSSAPIAMLVASKTIT
jgi:tellurite methyltransferase